MISTPLTVAFAPALSAQRPLPGLMLIANTTSKTIWKTHFQSPLTPPMPSIPSSTSLKTSWNPCAAYPQSMVMTMEPTLLLTVPTLKVHFTTFSTQSRTLSFEQASSLGNSATLSSLPIQESTKTLSSLKTSLTNTFVATPKTMTKTNLFLSHTKQQLTYSQKEFLL